MHMNDDDDFNACYLFVRALSRSISALMPSSTSTAVPSPALTHVVYRIALHPSYNLGTHACKTECLPTRTNIV